MAPELTGRIGGCRWVAPLASDVGRDIADAVELIARRRKRRPAVGVQVGPLIRVRFRQPESRLKPSISTLVFIHRRHDASPDRRWPPRAAPERSGWWTRWSSSREVVLARNDRPGVPRRGLTDRGRSGRVTARSPSSSAAATGWILIDVHRKERVERAIAEIDRAGGFTCDRDAAAGAR